ncbi:MAG: hypothetical protein M3277_00090 [Actinomycetota bacterium]|nr:hypothetical protein [Actinomycetota bacterium]
MARQTRKTRRTARTARMTSILSLLGIIALLVFSATPALAHHKADHSHGGGNGNAAAASDHDGDAGSESTAYTEGSDDDGTARPGGDSESLHPSGNDRRTEAGASGNQGKSESDPDDNVGPMRRECSSDGPVDPRGGCTDKPNGAGGVYDTDQDGNNGCGNDQDFDDDNNGWCGKPKAPAPTTEVRDEVKADDEVKAHIDFAKPKPPVPSDVLDKLIRRAAPVVRNAEVLGAVLPFTGGSVSYFAAAALGLIALGTLALRFRTNE